MSHIDLMIEAALKAGEVISDIYRRDIVAGIKADGSPVTEADSRAEAVILEYLTPTGLPVLAEESVAAGRVPRLGETYFVVDPLDGTKEFLKRNGEFTVNIALCEGERPTSGVVFAPATGALYWGGPEGAFKRVGWQEHRIAVASHPRPRIVASRSHGHDALSELMGKMRIAENVSIGSSLKFCMLADGKAELYPRFTPTSEWDTAAGQAVLVAAGGLVLTLDNEPLRYGKVLSHFINPHFVAAVDRDLALRGVEEMRSALGMR